MRRRRVPSLRFARTATGLRKQQARCWARILTGWELLLDAQDALSALERNLGEVLDDYAKVAARLEAQHLHRRSCR